MTNKYIPAGALREPVPGETFTAQIASVSEPCNSSGSRYPRVVVTIPHEWWGDVCIPIQLKATPAIDKLRLILEALGEPCEDPGPHWVGLWVVVVRTGGFIPSGYPRHWWTIAKVSKEPLAHPGGPE